MKELPLLFTIREIVEGPGFVAGVVCDGRALMVDEGEECWHVSGVEPGALSEIGPSPLEAYALFRQAFTDALKVLATDAYSYEAYAASLQRFFDYKDVEDEQRWQAARRKLQEGEEVDAPFKELPKEKAEERRSLKVVRLDYQAKASDQKEAARTVAVTDEVGIPTAA
jgi:hypothetical protein